MIMIDNRDRRPIYEQIIEQFSDLMVRGILKQDEQLPSVRSLATELSINPNTIQRSYVELERLGYIYSVKGRGSFVADTELIKKQKQEKLFERLGLLVTDAKALQIPKLTFMDKAAWFFDNEKNEDNCAPGDKKGGGSDDRS